jgi:uncharacterized protein involved in exopolysaccharide biosynthesis
MKKYLFAFAIALAVCLGTGLVFTAFSPPAYSAQND